MSEETSVTSSAAAGSDELLPLPLPRIGAGSPNAGAEGQRMRQHLVFEDLAEPPASDERDEPKTFTEEEVALLVQRAENDGYERGVAEGYEKGHGEAMEALEADMHRMHLSINRSLESLEQHYAALEERLRSSSVAFLKEVVLLLAPRIPQDFFDRHLREMVEAIAQSAIDNQTLIVRLPARQAAAFERQIVELLNKEKRGIGIEVLSDPHLAEGEAVASWDEGKITLNLQEFSDKIIETVLDIKEEL